MDPRCDKDLSNSLQQRAKALGNHELAQEIDRVLEATATP